ncbi:hypothetical protein PVL29_026805 [Vitis rotundifolia]|uniref:Condensin-2 complex subunit G2 n=1 Tax=Vitis rotundifolia TaxID=103349 RepID=A0AA38YHE7_VITRO|nr:hypothetical protein PVL29_026805 [Vitis rotundifolia]
MDKRLRSPLQGSPESFLSSATKLGLRSAKASLKSLIHGINPSSPLSSSLPPSLHNSISHSIASFQNLRDSGKSPPSPPTKRRRRSSRQAKTRDEEVEENRESGVLQDLQVLSHIVFLCVSHPKNTFPPADLLPAVQVLHDNLILFESDSVLLSEIANLCEEWWKDGLVGRETLISQSLPFLLSRSLTLKKKVDVHRVYMLREAFALFDFEDESIEDLKLLMIRCVITPLYLKTEDGRKFVAFMFGLSRQLVKEALAMIRSQIPFGRKSMLEAYGDIVFQAWKHVEGESRNEIENGFLQGLIEGAIHANSGALAASIRRVLGGFINQRTTNGVEKLLFRLTEPVIFRSLQVANSNVRLNSLHLLLDTFPLEDPDATKETKDTMLDKQFFLLERLLSDDCPEIRVVAVEGSCRILHLFWEIIPSSTITKMITKIFDDMSSDKCNEVRLSTLNGIMYLLGNPQSHEILKVLLPRLGHLILDPALSVRVAIADLLLLLSDIRTFQFHKVVGLDVLLSTLADDQPPVAQKITKLLIPSYFPSKVTPEEACKRCVTLIKRSPKAGARFCEFALSEGASMKSLLELVKVFISLVLSPNKLQGDQIESLLLAAANLCNNLVTEPLYITALKELFSGGKLKRLFAAAETGPAQSSVVNIISSISPDDAAEFVEECMGLVTDCSGLSENTERQEEVRSVHKLMLSCDWFDDMFDVLTRLLQKAAYGCHTKFGTEMPKQCVPSVKRKKTKSSFKSSAKEKHVSGKKLPNMSTSIFEEAYPNAVGVAWQIIDLIKSEGTRIATLRSKTLESAFFALKVVSEVSIVHCMNYEHMDTTPILAYSSLALHLTLQNISSMGAKNEGFHFSRSSSLETVLEQTMYHLFSCIEKLFQAGDAGKSAKLPSERKKDHKKAANSCRQKLREPQIDPSSTSDGGTTFSEQKRISNVMKMLTAVLKFIVDAATMRLVSNDGRFLKFTTIYIQYTISIIRQHSQDQLQFSDDDLRGTFLCLKSSLTYTAKFLNLVLANTNEASTPPPEAYNLANYLLDLIISVESYLGSVYAARLVTALKPWLPDLVLALGARHIMKQTSEEGTQFTESEHSELQLPSWTSILAKIELDELTNISPNEEAERVSEPGKLSSFKKLIGMMTLLLRGNSSILDAVGKVFMTASAVALEREDFALVLGLLHFVCVKLVGHEHRGWQGLDMMLASLEGIYPEIERQVEEPSSDEHGKQKLQKARALLEPIWINYTCESEGPSMMEE